MTKELKLGYKDLTWLGHAFENLSIISPMKLIQVQGFDESDKQKLIDKGIIGDDNRILPACHPMLETVAEANQYVETIFRRGPIKARRMQLGTDAANVSVTYTEDGIALIHPGNPQGMLQFLKEYTGGSKLTGGDLDLNLPPADMVLFASVCDLYRRAVLAAYSNEAVFLYDGFTADDLLKASNETRNNSQGLTFHIKALAKPGILFESDEVKKTLSSFVEQKLLKQEEGLYFPIGEAVLFAGNFLVIENSLDVIVGQVHDNLLYRSGFTMLQAGPLDLVMLEGSEESVTLQCLSAQSILSIMSSIMSKRLSIV